MAVIETTFIPGELVEPLIGPYCGLRCIVEQAQHHLGLILVRIDESADKGEQRLFHKNEIQHRQERGLQSL